MTEKVIPGIYEHYKGGRYLVFGEGIHTETREKGVVYKPLYEVLDPEEFQFRPSEMFLEQVEVDGQQVPRFKLVEPEDTEVK